MSKMNQQSDVLKDASPRGKSEYRHWLSRTWAQDGAMALVIGINPNTATDTEEDGITRFLVRLLRGLEGEFACRGYILVNCCDLRGAKPEKLQEADAPCSPSNLATVQAMLAKCDFVVASWGTAEYGPKVAECRNNVAVLVRTSKKRVICFSPKGQPIYCSQTNKNSAGRWSNTPVRYVGD